MMLRCYVLWEEDVDFTLPGVQVWKFLETRCLEGDMRHCGDQHVHYICQSCVGMVFGRVHPQKRMQDLWNGDAMTCLRRGMGNVVG